jgi:hydroxypyruvate isomerase
MKYDVCLEMVFTDLPYEKRIAKIAACGFDCVEFWFHDGTFNGVDCAGGAKDAKTLKKACAAAGVTINNMVVNAPEGTLGGSLVRAEDRAKYLARLEEVIAFAKACGCRKAITCAGNLQPGLSRNQMRRNLEETLGRAAAVAAKHNFVLFLECLNTRTDHFNYFLDSSAEGAAIVRAIASPNLRLLYDVYHMQIMEGSVIANIEENIDVIGHFHSAGVPGRHELMDGELNYQNIVRRIEAAGYTGAFGLEYSPALTDHAGSLRATRRYLDGAKR